MQQKQATGIKKQKKVSMESSGREEVEIQVENKAVEGHKIFTKLSPSLFRTVVENLTQSQREWVTSTGLGSILDFKLTSYPKYLGYGVVKSFVSDDCCILLDKRIIKITENDVHRILGLPLGASSIPFVNGKSLSKEWRKQYRDTEKCFRVKVIDVVNALKESMMVDTNFKKNFILVLIFFIQEPSNSYVRQNFLGLCFDLDKCFKYNWCELVVRYLKVSSKVWLRNTETRFYTGSLSFMLVCCFKSSVLKKHLPCEKNIIY